MRRVLPASFVLTTAFLCFGTHHAEATTLTTTTFATWKTDLTGSPTEANFTQISYTSYGTSAGMNLAAVGNSSILFNFTGPDGSKWALNGTKYNNYTVLEGGSDSSAEVKIALPGAGENAILLGLASTLSDPLTVTLSDGETFTTSNSVFGLSISHPITWLTVSTSAGSEAVISDFWYGTSSLTPDGSGSGGVTATAECSTLLLIAGGLFVLVGAHRKLNIGGPNSAV